MLLSSCYNDAENNYYDPPWANQCYRRKDHYDDADDKYDDNKDALMIMKELQE